MKKILTLSVSALAALTFALPVQAEEASRPEITAYKAEERRVGQECTSGCRSRWSPYH